MARAPDRRYRFAFAIDNEWKRAAMTFANERAPAKYAPSASTVFVNVTGLLLPVENFSQLVRKDKRRLVLAIQITGELESAMTFCAVRENRDCRKIVADRALTIREDRPGSNGELILATAAFPDWARGKGCHLEKHHIRCVYTPYVMPTNILINAKNIKYDDFRH